MFYIFPSVYSPIIIPTNQAPSIWLLNLDCNDQQSLNVHIRDQQSFIIKPFTLMKPFAINWRHWMISFFGYNLFWVCFLTVPEPKLFETKIISTKMFQPQDASFSFRRHFRLNQFMNTVEPRSNSLRVKRLMIIPLRVMRVQLRTPYMIAYRKLNPFYWNIFPLCFSGPWNIYPSYFWINN